MTKVVARRYIVIGYSHKKNLLGYTSIELEKYRYRFKCEAQKKFEDMCNNIRYYKVEYKAM